MKKYSKYKDTNIEWIGEIPEHWEVKRMKNIGELYSGLSGKSGKDFKQPENPNNKPYIPFSNIANNEKIDPDFLDYVVMNEDDSQNEVQKGDLFFLMSSENYDDVGKSSYLESELGGAYLNSFCKGFRLFDKSVNPSFLNWLLLSHPHRCRLMIEANGFTRINLKQDKIRDFYIYTPPLSEQTQISSYLDNKTSLIDKLINNNNKLIKLLEEKRTALINKVITKGLDPKVKMKDSGIEWIGEIPEHWEVKRVKHVAEVVTGTTPSRSNKENYSEDGYLWVKPDNLENLNTIFKTKEKISSIGIGKARLVPRGSVLVCGIGTIGKMGVAGKELTTNQQINSICFNDKVSSSYGKYLIFTSKPELEASSQKVVVSILNKTKQSLVKVPIPSLSEQTQISSYLDNKTSHIDKIIKKIKAENIFLKEYRQSLISNVVTGKINVQDDRNN